MAVDFGRTVGDYGRYRLGLPAALFDRLAAMGVGLPGQWVLDLGMGTGTLARGFARRGCAVTSPDPAEAMLEQARLLDAEAGVSVEYVVEATEALILAHNPRWRFGDGTGIHPEWPADVAIAGFGGIETFSFDEPAIYSHEAWRGRIRASAGVAASMSQERVERFDRNLAEILAVRFPDDPLAVPHRVFALVCTAPPG